MYHMMSINNSQFQVFGHVKAGILNVFNILHFTFVETL